MAKTHRYVPLLCITYIITEPYQSFLEMQGAAMPAARVVPVPLGLTQLCAAVERTRSSAETPCASTCTVNTVDWMKMTSRGLSLVVMVAATTATRRIQDPTARSTLQSTLLHARSVRWLSCDTEPCDGCSSLICQGCLRDGMCEECRGGWADTRAEYGIESDEDSDNDPYGY